MARVVFALPFEVDDVLQLDLGRAMIVLAIGRHHPTLAALYFVAIELVVG